MNVFKTPNLLSVEYHDHYLLEVSRFCKNPTLVHISYMSFVIFRKFILLLIALSELRRIVQQVGHLPWIQPVWVQFLVSRWFLVPHQEGSPSSKPGLSPEHYWAWTTMKYAFYRLFVLSCNRRLPSKSHYHFLLGLGTFDLYFTNTSQEEIIHI